MIFLRKKGENKKIEENEFFNNKNNFFDMKIISLIKENIWILGVGGILYQLFFLIIYDSLVLFSWTQIPADSVFFLMVLVLTYITAWPWFHDDFDTEKTKNLWLKSEIFYFGIFYLILFIILILNLNKANWFFIGIFIQLNISFIIYIFVIIKRRIGKNFSEKTKIWILGILVFLTCTLFGGNMYSNYQYFDYKNDNKTKEILYMNDKYILLENEAVKNDSGAILKKID